MLPLGGRFWPYRNDRAATGILGIGTDPDESYEGARLRQVWREQVAAAGGSMTIARVEVHAYEEGSVGWVADNPTFHLPGGV